MKPRFRCEGRIDTAEARAFVDALGRAAGTPVAVFWRGIIRYLAHSELKVWRDDDGGEWFRVRAQSYPKRVYERLFGPVGE
jgi:hypothetical protein